VSAEDVRRVQQMIMNQAQHRQGGQASNSSSTSTLSSSTPTTNQRTKTRRLHRRRERNVDQSSSSQAPRVTISTRVITVWERFKAKLPPRLQNHYAPPDLADEVRRRRLLDTMEFVGTIILTGLMFAVVVVAFVAVLVVI
jgi:hypothetical protein